MAIAAFNTKFFPRMLVRREIPEGFKGRHERAH